jgi:large subunit ribosomal protein L22
MAWKAQHRYAKMSARKVRLIVDMIRGQEVNKALAVLKYSPNRGAALVRKVLNSAIANADQGEADVEALVVKAAYVDEAPTMKRFQEKDRGRAFPIRKRNSHITVVVEEAK